MELEETVRSGIVTLHGARRFAMESRKPACSQVTGIIVDAERGYILTCKHFTGDGPFVGRAVLANREEVIRPSLSKDDS